MSKRYRVEWLDEDKALRLKKQRGGTEDESIWDFCEETDFTESRSFETKDDAFRWAREHSKLDMYGLPRVEEMTHGPLHDDLGNYEGEGWDRTGYWEIDGDDVTEIGDRE